MAQPNINMNDKPMVPPAPAHPKGEPQQRALKILARSIYKELRSQGYDSKQIVGFATELLGEITTEIATSHDAAARR